MPGGHNVSPIVLDKLNSFFVQSSKTFYGLRGLYPQ